MTDTPTADPGDPEFASQCPCSWLEFTDATEATLKIIVTDAETGEHPDWWSGWDFKLITAVGALGDAGQVLDGAGETEETHG